MPQTIWDNDFKDNYHGNTQYEPIIINHVSIEILTTNYLRQ